MGIDLWPCGYTVVVSQFRRGGDSPYTKRHYGSHSRKQTLLPYLYFVCDDKGLVRYVGKSLEDQVLQRWI